jgi:hypothetical protein
VIILSWFVRFVKQDSEKFMDDLFPSGNWIPQYWVCSGSEDPEYSFLSSLHGVTSHPSPCTLNYVEFRA